MGGTCDFSFSPSPFGFDFLTLDLGLTILVVCPFVHIVLWSQALCAQFVVPLEPKIICLVFRNMDCENQVPSLFLQALL